MTDINSRAELLRLAKAGDAKSRVAPSHVPTQPKRRLVAQAMFLRRQYRAYTVRPGMEQDAAALRPPTAEGPQNKKTEAAHLGILAHQTVNTVAGEEEDRRQGRDQVVDDGCPAAVVPPRGKADPHEAKEKGKDVKGYAAGRKNRRADGAAQAEEGKRGCHSEKGGNGVGLGAGKTLPEEPDEDVSHAADKAEVVI